MNARYPTALSLIGHAVLVGGLSLVTFRVDKKAQRKAGMEFEIIDSTHALALPDPSFASKSSTEAPPVGEARPVTDLHPAIPAPSQSPVLLRALSPAPEAEAPAAMMLALGPGPVAEVRPSVAPDPRPLPITRPVPPVAIATPNLTAPIVARSVRVIAEPGPQVTPQPRPTARLDPAKIAAGLDVAQAQRRRERLDSAALGSALGRAVPKGEGALTEHQRINLKELIRKQIHPCWNPPGKEGGEGLVAVALRIRLDRSGRLSGEPFGIVVTGQTGSNSAYARGLASSVVRAVKRCTPLDLPSELYAAWAEIELNFDPRDIQ